MNANLDDFTVYTNFFSIISAVPAVPLKDEISSYDLIANGKNIDVVIINKKIHT